jgi:tight adherence protein C
MSPLSWMGWAALALIAAAVVTLVYTFGAQTPAVSPTLGHRGLKRKRALERTPLLKAVDPAVRMMAAWFSNLPTHTAREHVEKQLAYAGHWLGIRADELFALMTLSGIGFTILGVFAADLIGFSAGLAVFFGALGVMLPYTRLTGEVTDRFRSINRQLPGSIDIAALCMGAGLDFPGALKQVVDKSPEQEAPIIEELRRILQEIDLGHTRRQALESFADRVPTDAVRDFVGAVVQAEQKGNPLSEVLSIQARMLRMRRSMLAEENAARAGVMMMAPLVLIFCAIILLLMGPFIIQGMQSGF